MAASGRDGRFAVLRRPGTLAPASRRPLREARHASSANGRHRRRLRVRVDRLRPGARRPEDEHHHRPHDVWWPDAEPGWGIHFVHNADVVFATLYVYNASGQPTFYVAALQNTPVGGGTWTGTLYSSTGTPFAAPWNTAAAAETPVGTMTFSLTGIGTGARAAAT